MGKVTEKIKLEFSMRGQGHHTGVRILAHCSVDCKVLGAPMDKDGGGYVNGKEGNAVRLEVCVDNAM